MLLVRRMYAPRIACERSTAVLETSSSCPSLRSMMSMVHAPSSCAMAMGMGASFLGQIASMARTRRAKEAESSQSLATYPV